MKLFEVFGEIKIKDGKALSQLKKVDDQAGSTTGKFKNMIGTLGKVGAGFAAMATGAGAALLGVATKTSESLNRIDKLSQKVGMTREGFQEWDYVMERFGGSMESAVGDMAMLSEKMMDANNGTGEGAELFAKLGMSVTDASGKLRSQEDVFAELIERLRGMEDATERNAIASAMLGGTGEDLVPILNEESAAIEDLKNEAHELGVIQSNEAVDAGVLFAESLAETKKMMSGLVTEIGARLLPKFNKFFDWIQDHLPEIKAIANGVFTFFINIVKLAGDVLGTFINIAKGIGGVFEDMSRASRSETQQMLQDSEDRKRSLQDELSATIDAKKERIAAVEEERSAAIEAKRQEISARRDALSDQKEILRDRMDSVDEYTQDEIDAYKEMTDTKIEDIDRELEAFEEAKSKELALLDEQYQARLKTLSQEEQAKIQALEDEIADIEEQTKEEERILREQREQEKIARLEDKIEEAETSEEKQELRKELSDYRAELARDELLRDRKKRKNNLKEEIKNVETEYDEKETVAETHYEKEKTDIESQIEFKKIKAEEEKEMYKNKLADFETKLKESAKRQKATLEGQIETLDTQMSNVSSSMMTGLNAPFDAAIDKINEEFKPEIKALKEDIDEVMNDIEDVEKELKKAEEKQEDLTSPDKYIPDYSGGNQEFGQGFDFGGMKAEGGDVQAGTSYVVGEFEPELFTPRQDGYITPASKMGGVTVQNMIVREEADIDKIARKLFNLQRDTNRGYAI